jgi:D-glycero-D-manno-heptose 1,7-bisphosphate phosphatase
MAIKTIFLDRDGVINHEVNYLYKISDFKFIDGIFEACISFGKLGYKIIIVSNQSGIARGYYSEDDYQNLTKWLMHQFKEKKINILDSMHCPHSPNDNCICRKPMPGMFFAAKKTYNIDMKKSWMIGDKETDIQAAIASGIGNTILVSSGHIIDKQSSSANFFLKSIKESIQIIKN